MQKGSLAFAHAVICCLMLVGCMTNKGNQPTEKAMESAMLSPLATDSSENDAESKQVEIEKLDLSSMTAGTYSGTGKGNSRDIKVDVTVNKNYILDLVNVEQTETEGYAQSAR